MKQKITLYVLLLLVCRAVAAEPINKPDNTTAAHPSISPKNVETIPTGPANVLFGSVPDLLLSLPVRLAHMREAASLEVVSLPTQRPRLASDASFARPQLGSSAAIGLS